MSDIEIKSGYCTITYKLKIYINHMEYIKLTKDIYNEVVLIYYNLLFEHLDYLNLSNQYCLRELEKLTIIGRDGEIPDKYIDMDLPTYFRRAAINQAIGSVRSFISLQNNFYRNENRKGNPPTKATNFNYSPIFYKGMYKDLTSDTVLLKLWNGKKWNWYKGKLRGRSFNNEFETMSPTVVINSNFAMLHVPVRMEVKDVRTVKERMQDEDLKVCSIAFSNTDFFAICTILNKSGEFVKVKFVSGGDKYKNQAKKITDIIKNNRRVNTKITQKDHKNYWDKLARIDEDTAHKVSKEIIDFCILNNVKVISIAKVEEDVASFKHKVGTHSPIYLKRKIINDLEYKSFKSGIVITTVRQNYTASKCYKCRAKVKRQFQNEFVCENGHTGNYYFNTAMNIGKMCLKKFGLIL